MIERGLVAQRIKEFQIQEYVKKNLRQVGHSKTLVQRTPLGEKIVIYASRPGLIVGKKGANIKKLTLTLKKLFDLENPQIEISEIEKPDLDAAIVAERIANSLERFGPSRFKGVGHKTMEAVMQAGALGVEILVSGKIPSARARSWRFYQGYLKKCGDVALSGVSQSITAAHLKSGTIGIQVRIMPPNLVLPDKIEVFDKPIEIIEEVEETVDPTKAKARGKGAAEKSRASPARDGEKKTKASSKKVPKRPAKKQTKGREPETADAPADDVTGTADPGDDGNDDPAQNEDA